MNLHKQQLYLLQQHSESFKIWTAIIRINRQTDRHFIRRILMYIVIQNGLQYNAHDSGHSIKQDKKERKQNKTHHY